MQEAERYGSENITLAQKYKIIKKIGSGSFG